MSFRTTRNASHLFKFYETNSFPPNIKSDILWLQKCCVLARNILPVLVSVAAETPDKFNPLTPNDPYRGRTAPLTSKRCILYIYSTNIGTEYFKHCIYSPFFVSLQNAVCFIILTYLVPVLFTFYIQNVLKLKKNNSGAKRLHRLTSRKPAVTAKRI